MTQEALGKFGRCALWLSPIVIIMAAVFAMRPWLRPQNPALFQVMSFAAAAFVIGYSLFLARRVQRHQDEVQTAGERFATSRGWVWGAGTTILLLALPPVTNALIDVVSVQTTGTADEITRQTVRLAFIYGACLLVLIQTLAIIVASAIWSRRMGLTGDPS